MEKIIGIDLGTTNSVVAVLEGGNAVIIPNSSGARIMPSVVAFTKEDHELLVGQIAKNQAIINSENTVQSIKRKMGENTTVAMCGRDFTPEEISAFVLKKLKKDAEEYIGHEIKKAVITVPAYFNDTQREATINAGRIAGLEVARIINEPTAAALSYGLNEKEEQNVLVFDLGGGTYDVSILEIGEGVLEVKATNGDNHLGGDDFDKNLVDHICETFLSETGVDLKLDKMALQRLYEAVVTAKIELSERKNARINIPFITADSEGPKHLDVTITRALFEKINAPLIERIEEPLMTALEDAALKMDEIDRVILVGGSTRIPAVQEKIENLTQKEMFKGVNPDECVALGAAVQGGIITGEKRGVVLVDVIPLTLGIEVEGGYMVPLVEKNTAIPYTNKRLFTTISDNQNQVEIKIYQGEEKFAAQNKFLGNFLLKDIRNAQKGEPRVEVSFDVDVNGILKVTAIDLDTNSVQEIEIQGTSHLTDDQVEDLKEKSRKIEEEDQKQKEKTDKENRIEKLVSEGESLIEQKEEELDEKAELKYIELEEAVEELGKMDAGSEDIEEMLDIIETMINELKNLK